MYIYRRLKHFRASQAAIYHVDIMPMARYKELSAEPVEWLPIDNFRADVVRGLDFTLHGVDKHISPTSIISIHLEIEQGSDILFAERINETEIRIRAIHSTSRINYPSTYHLRNIIRNGATHCKGHIIVSVLSGTNLATSFYENVIKPLLVHLEAINSYTVHLTTSAKTVSELTKNVFLPAAKEGHSQQIILLSGDGGIVDIVNELLATDGELSTGYKQPEISLIPLGTGNSLAHSSRITKDDTIGLSSWLTGHPHNLPLFKVDFSHDNEGAALLVDEGRQKEALLSRSTKETCLWGAVVFSWGFHAQIVADSDTAEFRKNGIDRFKVAAHEALFPADGSGPHKYKGSVAVKRKNQTNWTSIGEEWSYVMGTLVSNLEEKFIISPRSEPFNNTLRLVHFGAKSGDEIIRIMGLAYQGGKHIGDAEVGYEEDLLEFMITFREEEDKWRRVCVDGKIILVEKGGWVSVRMDNKKLLDLMVNKRLWPGGDD